MTSFRRVSHTQVLESHAEIFVHMSYLHFTQYFTPIFLNHTFLGNFVCVDVWFWISEYDQQ